MVKKILILFFLILLATQFVYAVDTPIEVKTIQFAEVYLSILNPNVEFEAYATYSNNSDYYGDVSFIHSGSQSSFDIYVVLKKDGERIFQKKYEGYYAGSKILIEAIPEGYEVPKKNFEIEEISTKNSSNFIGYAILEFPKRREFSVFLYIIASVLFLTILLLLIKQKLAEPRNIKITKLSELNQKNTNLSAQQKKEMDKLIAESEEKLKKAKEELIGLKREQKIREIKEQLRLDQEELRRLYQQENK